MKGVVNLFGNPYMNQNPYQNQFTMGINWVDGINQVDNIELAPGGMAVFFDKTNDNMMYIRTRDRYSIYNTRIFKIEEQKPKQPESQFVTRTELEEMLTRIIGGMKNESVQPINEQQSATTNTSRNAIDNTTTKHGYSSKRQTNDANA